MANKNYYGLIGKIVATVDSIGTILQVDPNTALRLVDFVNGADATWLMLRSGNVSEVVKVTAVNGNLLTVDRGQEYTDAEPFPAGSMLSFILTATAVMLEVGEVLPTQILIYDDDSLLRVSTPDPNTYEIWTINPNIQGIGQIDVTGAWPDIQISYTAPADACCDGGGGGGGGSGGDVQLYGDGVIEVTPYGNNTWGIFAPQVNLYSGTGINITGGYPDYTINATVSGGVSSVAAGAGLQLTGSPTVNPTLSMANTGVTPGDYGGFVINARGQITQVPAGFNPISSIVTAGALNDSRTGGVVNLTIDQAGVGVQGTVALADSTTFDPADSVNAVTPAGVAHALETVVVAEVLGSAAYIGDSDSEYTNIISGATTSILLEAGERALVHAEVTILDPAALTTPVQYGIGVFSSTPARIASNRKIPQCQQSLHFIIDGPMSTALSLATTDIGAATMVSYSMSVIKF